MITPDDTQIIPLILQGVRVLGLSVIAFIIALAITPIISRVLLKRRLYKPIREDPATPIFSGLPAKKAGTPTMGGLIVWLSVLGLAVLLSILARFFDGFWDYLNFIDRRETYLPIAAMFIAALLGLMDDFLGVRKIGPRGGGLSMTERLPGGFLF